MTKDIKHDYNPKIKPASDSSSWSSTRAVLRSSWNGLNSGKTNFNNKTGQKVSCTPMRRAWNSGDPLMRQNYSCGGSSQTTSMKPGIARLVGGLANTCDDTNVEPSYANNKWVYDGTDYTTFKKQQALKHNYHDDSFGGANAGTVASTLWRVRK